MVPGLPEGSRTYPLPNVGFNVNQVESNKWEVNISNSSAAHVLLGFFITLLVLSRRVIMILGGNFPLRDFVDNFFNPSVARVN